MPKFIGNDIASATKIQNNARAREGYARLSYSQAVLVSDQSTLLKSLDTSDKGGPRVLAKRWYRWFAPKSAVLDSPRATANMRRKAA